ncbi:polysaccharide pyruvyl transferase family protein [Methylotenera versatilis]|uniref:polysaccharide pyruvyl transferase family protein n=1 Tax=Methylotenera versatilis TaxID=1055487 RepID=UPI0006486768|nr:polysaccharide pyruvyl transferase family protein [Methylotenera versatilis]
MKTASIITTVRHNIGDDFVREGILSVLRDVAPIQQIELIHKHSPVTAVYGQENLRNLRISRVSDPVFRVMRSKNRITDADLLIQSGAPVYWCHPNLAHCANNEWFDPLIKKRFLPDRRGRKFLNIAGGSCQTYHSNGIEVETCLKCKAYIAEFFDACDLTLLRDDLAKKMLNIAGRDADVLPCTSIFARDYLNIAPKKGEYIVVNFMENGGHYTFSQNIDAYKWRKNFALIVQKLQRHGRVIAACHTSSEEKLAKEIVPDVETYIVPNEHVAFMNFYAAARFAIVNRVHAGFMMASFGKPAAVIGNDSRALMIKNLNLLPHYVEDVDGALIDIMIDDLLAREHTYRDEVEEVRSKARSAYVEKISTVI